MAIPAANPPRLRILCVIPSLGGGGAEHVMCRLVNHWAEERHHVLLVTFEPQVKDFFTLDPAVERVRLAPAPVFGNKTVGRVVQARSLRRTLERWRADVIIAFQRRTSMLAVLATRRMQTPLVVSDRNDPRGRPSPRWKDLMANVLLRRADTIVVQNEGIATWARAALPEVPVAVITNAVFPPDVSKDPSVNNKTVIAMGRLHHQKGFDLLLRAFAECVARHPDWRLVILGDGEERSRLVTMIHSLGLSASVDLVGFVRNPQPHLAASDIFVFPSRWEGFGLALAEAMACGLPVVSFDCLSGPAELIRDGYDGVLIKPGDVHGLTEAITRLIEAPELRRRLGSRARDVVERFSADRALGQWDALFRSLVTTLQPSTSGRRR